MKHHPAWLAMGLLVFVVLACNLGKKTDTNTNANANVNSNTQPSARCRQCGAGNRHQGNAHGER